MRWALGVSTIILIAAGLLFYRFIYWPATEAPTLNGTLEQDVIEVDNRHRSYLSYIPGELPDNPPLVFVFHGSRGTGEQMRAAAAFEFDTLADREGYIVIYPDGYENHWNDCRKTADYAANVENIDDPLFISTIIEQMVERFDVNRNQVFATGLSNGGHMVYRLALENPGLIKAAAPIAASMPVAENMDCQSRNEPVSIAIFNGVEDPLNPYEGGLVSLYGNTSRGTVLSSYESVLYWAGLAGAAEIPGTLNLPEIDGNSETSIRLHTWRGDYGVEVRLYQMVGSGHVLPSKIAKFPRMLGEGAQDISGPEEIIGFFQSVGDW
jgi:polyhydroxybutyrate depolymerase